MTISNHRDKSSQTLDQLMLDLPLIRAVEEVSTKIRHTPTDRSQRWLLFQLLCLQCDWPRAIQQLQTFATMQSNFEKEAHTYRGLIGCEQYRKECFAGRKQPGFIESPPIWVNELLEAIILNQSGQEKLADDTREAALEVAETASGYGEPLGAFSWISDSDSWLGPTIELVIGGIYTWIPFCQIHSISAAAPKTILDLLWKPIKLSLINGSEHHAVLLARSCYLEHASDAIRLCRETVWHEHGRTSIRAMGQKTWQTDQDNIGVLEITSCQFNVTE